MVSSKRQRGRRVSTRARKLAIFRCHSRGRLGYPYAVGGLFVMCEPLVTTHSWRTMHDDWNEIFCNPSVKAAWPMAFQLLGCK